MTLKTLKSDPSHEAATTPGIHDGTHLRSVMGSVGVRASRDEPTPFLASMRAPTSEFTVGTVRSISGLLALEDEWRELETRLPCHPFVSFDWNVAWWQHMHERKRLVVDELSIKTFRTASGKLCAVAPLMVTVRPAVGPIRMRQLHFFGADSNMTEIRGVAVPDELRQSVYLALLKEMKSTANTWDWLIMSGLPSAPTITSAMQEVLPTTRWLDDVPISILRLPPTWAEFKTGLSRNIKESLRKCQNAPKRDGLTLTPTVARTPSDVATAVEKFLHLHRCRSDRMDTIHHQNVFKTADSRRFLRDVCQRYAARDALRIFQLTLADEVIATRIGFLLGNTLYLYYSGYNPNYAKYSVMTTTLAHAIQYAIGNGIQIINLSTGNDLSKERWNPERFTYRSALVVSQTLRGQIAHGTFAALRKSLAGVPVMRSLHALVSRGS